MSDDRSAQDEGFSVKDKRCVTEDGDPKQDADQQAAPAAAQEPEQTPQAAPGELPAIDFSTFILSMSQSAMVHMGETPLPGGGVMKQDLTLAKQTIDILDLIRQKTQGNLTPEEAELLRELLYNLRLAFVKNLS